MRYVLFVPAIACFLFGLALACTKTSADKLNPPGGCDTLHVTYSQDVLPILKAYCYTCHAGENTVFSNGISLEKIDFLKFWGDTGYLLGNITHASGYVGMPYGKPKLPDCEVNKIIAWVNQKYPE